MRQSTIAARIIETAIRYIIFLAPDEEVSKVVGIVAYFHISKFLVGLMR